MIRKCKDDNDICIPTEKYCNRQADCPSGSDESDCSCNDLGMTSCNIEHAYFCVYNEWITNKNLSAHSCDEISDAANNEFEYDTKEDGFEGCVKVSPEGKDSLSCLSSSFNNSCKSLEYALRLGANVICVSGNLYGKTEYLSHTDLPVDKVIIGNSTGSSLRGYEIFLSSSHSNQIQNFVFINLIFIESQIKMWNVGLIFKGCTFRNVLIKDGANSTFSTSELSILDVFIEDGFHNAKSAHAFLVLYKSLFLCGDEKTKGIYFAQKPIVRINISQSEIIGCQINLYVGDIVMTVGDSYILQTFVYVRITSVLKVPTLIKRGNTTFNDSGTLLFRKSITYVKHHSYIDVIDCILVKTRIGLNMDILSVFINNSSFIAGATNGNGGALSILSHNSKSKVLLSRCNFEQNVAREEKGSTLQEISGRGGALFVKGQDKAKIDLTVDKCTFKDNVASVTGAALYMEEGVSLYSFKCRFINNINNGNKNLKVIVYSVGTIEYFQGKFVINNAEPKLYEGTYDIIETDTIKLMTVDVQCPHWYVHATHYIENNKVFLWLVEHEIKQLSYKCSPCSDGYYTASSNKGKFQYPLGENGSLTHQGSKTNTCIKCPYGAYCPGNDVIPRPNYWGYWYENELSFEACPAGYCCSGNNKAPCSRFDSCADNRTGVLCGACTDGFSLSILTGKCTPNSQCQEDRWFWWFAVMVALTYTLWYIFKDDIFELFFITLKMLRLPKVKITSSKSIKLKSSKETSKRVPSKLNSLQTSRQAMKCDQNLKPNIKELKADTTQLTSDKGESLDKGYFGIVTFFVQMSAAMAIEIEFSEVDNSKSLLDTITEKIGKFLGIQFSELSLDACPLLGLTTAGKNAFGITFLLGIYLSWLFLFALCDMIGYFVKTSKTSTNTLLKSLKPKLIKGLIEIIKYTYSGFCGIIFMSLVCVKVGSDYVWWYDATNMCLENWQISMVILGIIYAGPFPLALFTSMRMLRSQYITAWGFILCCLFPPLALYHNIRHKRSRKPMIDNSKQAMSDEANAIISILQGPYREDDKNLTLYWEAMVSLRRLMITVMTLIGSASIRMMFITTFCMLFTMQHIFIVPFKAKQSNYVESFSLFLLSLVAVINLLKASLTDSGTIPTGPSVSFFKGLEFTEHILLVILLAFIVFVEVNGRKVAQKIKSGVEEKEVS